MRECSRFVRAIHFYLYSSAVLSLACGSANADTLTTVTTFEYNPNGVVSAVVRNPDDPKVNLRTQYTYDSWGNRVTTAVSSTATGSAAIPSFTVELVSYDAWGISPVGFTNAVGYTTNTKFDAGNLPLYVDELNGLRTQWEYDGYGRVSQETRPDKNRTNFFYTPCSPSTPCSAPNAVLMVTKYSYTPGAQLNGPTVKTYYDTLNRVVRTETTGFDGVSNVVVDTEYDRFGRVYRTSRPYYAGQAIRWTAYNYDALGRVVDVTGPDGAVVHTDYNGQTTTVTNPLNQKRSTTVNGRGLTSQVIDDAGNVLQYKYDAAGRLVQTIDPKGNVISMAYDLAGNKIVMTDPDFGTINYVYDALGRLKQQTDAKGQVTAFQYDSIGRVTNRTEPDLISTWTYDSCAMGRGKLCSTSADNGYKSTTAYGSDGRVSQSVTTIDKDYASLFTYDANGRLATLQYPSGFKVNYTYTQLGYLSEVRNTATNALYWKANRMDAEGHLLEQAYGNGVVTQQDFDPLTGRIKAIRAGANASVQNLAYTYDKRGNLLTRSDSNQSLSESFLYDNLNRITSNTVNSTGAGLVTQTYAYDSIGNITRRSDVGTYAYGAVNTRPHAVAQITRADGSIRQFTYDNSGNLVQEVERDAANNVIAPRGRTETWTSFNMPLTLANASTSVQFVYGSDHQRIKEINPTYTTYFVHPDNAGGLLYERDVKSTGTVEQRHFITAGAAGAVAIVKRDASGVETGVVYLHRDNLGSVTAVTDTNAIVSERMAYEPFGKRRAAGGAIDANGTLSGINTNRGYTNHEELDSLGLVHMNGRVYDPSIGRFINPDPTVPYKNDLQSINRFSYTRNNPLRYIDLSGYDDEEVLSDEFEEAMEEGEKREASGGGGSDDEGTGCKSNYICRTTYPDYRIDNRGDTVVSRTRDNASEAFGTMALFPLIGATAAVAPEVAGFAEPMVVQIVGKRGWSVPKKALDKLPETWGPGLANKKKIGQRWQDPANQGNGVRIDKGDPLSKQPSQQVDHVVVRYNGKVIGRDGNPISGTVKENFEESHIPLSEYLKWTTWFSP
jgi:RHS repeat-associated protein